jgi:hypothetical protein
MKNNKTKKLITTLLVFLLITLIAAPALSAPALAASATVDVVFVVKNPQGPYKGVNIQFGKNTKTTGDRGAVSFHLENIPVTTMVQAHLVDPNIPTGYFCDINLALGAHEDVKVNSTKPYGCNLSIMFTEYTKTIVIEYFVDSNYNYGYSNATFQHIQQTNPQPPSTPKPTAKPQAQGDPAPPPPPEEFHDERPPEQFHDERPPEEFHDEMPPEEFRDERPPEEFNEDWNPEDEHYAEPYRDQFGGTMIPAYVWIIVTVGAVLTLAAVVIIVVMVRKNKKRNV